MTLLGENPNPNQAQNCRFRDQLGLCFAYEAAQAAALPCTCEHYGYVWQRRYFECSCCE